MNWPALFFSFLAGTAFWYSGYLFGLKIGHMRGHRCEAIMQRIYAEPFPTEDKEEA